MASSAPKRVLHPFTRVLNTFFATASIFFMYAARSFMNLLYTNIILASLPLVATFRLFST